MMSVNAFLILGVLPFSPIDGYENLARIDDYRGQASQSSSYPDNKWPADKAVDGQLQGRNEDSCSLTKGDSGIQSAWWKFPLKILSNVAYIEIFFRRLTVDRHAGFPVYVFNKTSYVPPSPGGYRVFTLPSDTCPNQTMRVTVNRVTKGVALFNSNQPSLKRRCPNYEESFASIEICEVYVMGCQARHFGPRCDFCDPKCLNSQCDAFNGSCIYGCNNSLMVPPNCNVCKGGHYGMNCEYVCGQCITGTYCETSTGNCPNSCQEHWSGQKCDVCKEGFYGRDCNKACEKCKTGTVCNNITGVCSHGCQAHWDGYKCDVCKRGFYGQQCGKTCGTCKTGTYCNNITGICPDGCEIHSTGEKCDVCKDGFYGKSCAIPCGNCKAGTYCDIITGICKDGCQQNWAGEKCDECQRYKYGPNCAFDCGHCKNGKPCSEQNGTCLNGCEAGWSGLFCLKVLSSTENLKTDEGISKTSSIIIAIVSTLLVIVLICLGIKIVKKRRTQEKAKAVTETVTSTTQENPQFYDQISGTEMDHVYQQISPTLKKDDYQDSHRYLNTEIVNESKY